MGKVGKKDTRLPNYDPGRSRFVTAGREHPIWGVVTSLLFIYSIHSFGGGFPSISHVTGLVFGIRRITVDRKGSAVLALSPGRWRHRQRRAHWVLSLGA